MLSKKRAVAEIQRIDMTKDALQMRIEGMTYKEIGEALGVATSTAFKYIQKSLREMEWERDEEAANYRRIVLERNETMIAGLLPEAQSGSHRAVDQVLKVQEQTMDLLGIERKGVKKDHTVEIKLVRDSNN